MGRGFGKALLTLTLALSAEFSEIGYGAEYEEITCGLKYDVFEMKKAVGRRDRVCMMEEGGSNTLNPVREGFLLLLLLSPWGALEGGAFM